MAATIQSSIVEGFKTANRSWKAMAAYIGAWAVIFAILAGTFFLTNPPMSALKDTQAWSEQNEEREKRGEKELPLPPETKQALKEWGKRAWPIGVLAILLSIFVSVALYGGTLGYLVHQVHEGSTPISVLFVSGILYWPKVFASFLLGWLVSVPFFLVFLAAALLGNFNLAWLAAIVGFLGVLAAFGFMIWIAVRAAFWRVAIFAHGSGVIESFKASWNFTRGQWLKTFGLIALLVLLSIAANILTQVLGILLTVISFGHLALVLPLIYFAVQVYISFWVEAAYVSYYLRSLEEPATSIPPTPL